MMTKYELLAKQLREELVRLRVIGELRLPTESVISETYNVSRQTVRCALKLLESENLIEKRHGSGSYIKSPSLSSNNQIAILATYVDDYIFPKILKDVQEVLSESGYCVSIYSTDNSTYQENKIVKKLIENPVAGILVEGVRTAIPNPNVPLYKELHKTTPMIFLHGVYPNFKEVPYIVDDNFNGGYELVKYLISKGHKKIGGIFKSDDMQGLQRYDGCMSALRDAVLLQPDSRFCWYATSERKQFLEYGNCDILKQFIRANMDECTAFVCYNDEIAYLLIKELISLGIQVPNDVAVVSFDNSYYSHLSSIPITSLGHDSKPVGQIAAAELLGLINSKTATSHTLSWRLFARNSG